MRLNTLSGVVSGSMYRPNTTNTVTVSVIGNDPQHTEKTMRLTIISVPDEDNGENEKPSDDQT